MAHAARATSGSSGSGRGKRRRSIPPGDRPPDPRRRWELGVDPARYLSHGQQRRVRRPQPGPRLAIA
eukprot:6415515-Lingulodinium_polyedra.AAC.1